MTLLSKRQYYNDDDDGCGYYGNCYSPWAEWGRWVVLAAIIFVALLAFFIFSFINARRRRRRGAQPYRGTGWLAPGHGSVNYYGPGGSNAQPYYGHGGNAQQPYHAADGHQGWQPPSYDASNAGYYNGQQQGTELQQPGSAYHPQRGGDAVYNPPTGPPPGKGANA